MNEINASRRLKEAASHKAEAEYVFQCRMTRGNCAKSPPNTHLSMTF